MDEWEHGIDEGRESRADEGEYGVDGREHGANKGKHGVDGGNIR